MRPGGPEPFLHLDGGGMKLAVFDTHRYDRDALEAANARHGHHLTFFEPRLTRHTAGMAAGYDAVCCFVHDRLDDDALRILRSVGVRLITLRCAGYNQVDLEAAARHGLPVVRVPEYSPYAVAEHTIALLLALDRRLPRAVARVREWNFSLEGLVGFDLHAKTAGVVGTGRIGAATARILAGFGCRVLAHDPAPSRRLVEEAGVRYVDLPRLFRESDIISLHVPLSPSTHHLIDANALELMKPGVILLNTGRGALIDSRALVAALKAGHVGGAGLDVYEEEEGVFYRDLSSEVLQDDVLARLLTFPNVLVTSHQAFLTREALAGIAETTLGNVSAFEETGELRNEVRAEAVMRGRPEELGTRSP